MHGWVLLLWGCLTASAGAVEAIVTRGIAFAKIGDSTLQLDLYQSPDAAAPAPLIIWIHGGAWRSGDRGDMPLGALPAKGFTVASLDYRLTPVAPFPANIHDIKAGVRFLRARAADYRIDPDRIVLAGASAGGHLAALAALTFKNTKLEGTVGDYLQTSSKVQAVISFFGASDLTTILGQSTAHGLSVRIPALHLLYGGAPKLHPELARLASPVFHLDREDPPILLFHGDRDNQMPPRQSKDLALACEVIGVNCQLRIVPGGAHGGSAFFGAEMMEETARFLRSKLTPRTPAK